MKDKYSFLTSRELIPTGWMRRQLEIEAKGLAGNLDKVWRDVRDSKWIGGTAEGWERVPYWLDGFIDISQNTKDVCFVGTFTAGGLKEEVRDGKLVIIEEGRQNKFIKNVQQITFSGEYANTAGQKVMYITERAVFKLTDAGLMLTEIAPGIDLEKDILAHMEFKPIISQDLKLMDEAIFRDEPMGLKDMLSLVPNDEAELTA